MGWKLVCGAAGSVVLSMWRRNGGDNEGKLIGKNQVTIDAADVNQIKVAAIIYHINT